jgi:hypothetical protein
MNQLCDRCKKKVSFVYHMYRNSSNGRALLGRYCENCCTLYKENQYTAETLHEYSIDHLHYMAPIEKAIYILVFGIFSRNMFNKFIPYFKDLSCQSVQHRRQQTYLLNNRSLHDYIPLYFSTHTPTQYIMSRDLNQSHDSQYKYMVFIEVDALSVFLTQGIIFSDGNAASDATVFYDNVSKLKNLDWNTINSRSINFYSNEEKRRKAAEVLVPNHISNSMFKNVVVYNQEAIDILSKEIARISANFSKNPPSKDWIKPPDYEYCIDKSHFF